MNFSLCALDQKIIGVSLIVFHFLLVTVCRAQAGVVTV